jgi:C4-dicarboxylate-specific signal transduction histidine kinase
MIIWRHIFIFLALLMTNVFVFLFFSPIYFSTDWNFNESNLMFLIILGSLCLINFLLSSLIAGIVDDDQKKIKKMKNDSDQEMKCCVQKITDSYNFIEAGKISLGVYHDLANILTASNLALHEIFVKSKNDLVVNKLTKKAFAINKQANSLISSFKRQCQKDDYKVEFYLKEEIEKCLVVFNFYFIKYNIKIDLQCLDNIKTFGDPVKFGQMFNNLITNSIESFSFTKKDKKIDIKVFNVDGKVKIIFKDSGLGISPDNLNYVFKPFFSSKKDNNNQHCGIGLTIVKKIIKQDFLGEISVNSKLGQGTEFVICLSSLNYD